MAGAKDDDQAGEEFSDPDLRRNSGHVEELTKKIDALESERGGLANEIAVRNTEIDKLMHEVDALREGKSKMREKIEGLGKEFERSQAAKKAAEAAAAKKADLEAEVSRLNRESIFAKSAAEGSRTVCAKLRSVLEEKESMVLNLEWEVKGLKEAKLEIDKKVKDLERKIGVLQLREIAEKSKRIRAEVELGEEIEKKEKEIRDVRQNLKELQRVASGSDWIKEKLNLEEALRESEEKGRSMESNALKLQEKVQEAGNAIRSMKEKAHEAVNGKGLKLNGLKLQWPVVAGSTAAIAAAAVVIYGCCGKRT